MEITTVRFGTMTVEEEKVLSFPKGILGFSQHKRFVLFPHTEGSPLFWLQSIDDGSLAFVVMNPQLVKKDYTIDVEQTVLEQVDARQISDLEVMCIITIPPQLPQKMTINLLGPIIINVNKRLALQIVCTDDRYSHRHPVLSEQ